MGGVVAQVELGVLLASNLPCSVDSLKAERVPKAMERFTTYNKSTLGLRLTLGLHVDLFMYVQRRY